MKKYKVILLSGGFDPVHRGHVEFINKASELGDQVWIGLNDDQWLKRKKGKYFMEGDERRYIMSNLKNVDYVYLMNPKPMDDTSIDFIEHSFKRYKRLFGEYKEHDMAFGNGGDRVKTNTPENDLCTSLGIDSVWGLGEKVQSSSFLLQKYVSHS